MVHISKKTSKEKYLVLTAFVGSTAGVYVGDQSKKQSAFATFGAANANSMTAVFNILPTTFFSADSSQTCLRWLAEEYTMKSSPL